jgi:hypothetical protein
MILDKETLFADALAFGGTPEELDLGTVRPGPGQPIKCFFTTHAALTGCTAVNVLDAAVSPADEVVLTVTPPPAAGDTVEFELPSTVLQFVTIDLVGTVSAGSYSCGIVLPGVQTNQ